jgi:RNA polymerase sigma-70 factor (ECF subfamily)
MSASPLPVPPPRTPGTVARFPPDRAGDAVLVAAAARGDREAIGAVWDRYAELVRRVLRGALGPSHAGDALVQEVFLAFVRGAKNISDGSALRSYLAGIAVRLAALEIRRNKVRRWVMLSPTGELPEQPVAPHDVPSREALRALDRVLSKLSVRRRMAFVLRDVEGLEMLDVAATLEISESTLRRELLRAREQVLAGASREPALAEFVGRTVRREP